MFKNYTLIIALIALSLNFNAHTQCTSGFNTVIVQITPDNYPQEISWELRANGSLVANGGSVGDTVCIPSTQCIELKMIDSFGDGICCNYGNGSYNLIVNGVVEATGGNYGFSETVNANCPPGTSCENPIAIGTGSFTAPMANSWYEFTAPTTGIYTISTCAGNTCDTKIWVYDACTANINETNTGTQFYDDNQGGCGEQAVVEAYMAAGQVFYIRIGIDGSTTCATSQIPFVITYDGPVVGCMDPNACNYNPIASSAGQCYYYPDPNCPLGPDLIILESAVESSLNMRTELATNCMVEEGCMNGYGNRTVIAFDTHIQNIGETDYYIGNPTNNPTQFTFGNCHGHAHYEGYADYVLYKPNGTSIPIGHKNGFCVMDLECQNGGTAQYGCSNMGITKDCGDIYNNGLDCQWIDVTDVDTGEYILAIKVNWDQSPDALGRYEMGYDNNWAQVCIRITKDANGVMGYVMLPNCQPYYDCAGVMYGNSVVDCEGDCGGTAVRGDVDLNSIIELNDAVQYVNGILASSISPTECKDITSDGAITVWDAGVAQKCALKGAPNNNYCEFPNTVVNTNQYAELGYTVVNPTQQYVDIYIRNPDSKIVGYEFNVSGIEIATVENLIDPLVYPATPQFTFGGTKVVCLSYQDSLIPKNTAPAPLCRIYYTQLTGPTICIDEVIHVLNADYQPIVTATYLGCNASAEVNEVGMQNFNLYPNPGQDIVNIQLQVKAEDHFKVLLVDATGRTLMEQKMETGSMETTLDVAHLSNGIYQVVLSNGSTSTVKSLSILK